MSLVRFAEVCDDCGRRGEEYTSGTLWHCLECGIEVCDICVAVKVRPFCCGAPDCRQTQNEGLCAECVTGPLAEAARAGAPHLEVIP